MKEKIGPGREWVGYKLKGVTISLQTKEKPFRMDILWYQLQNT